MVWDDQDKHIEEDKYGEIIVLLLKKKVLPRWMPMVGGDGENDQLQSQSALLKGHGVNIVKVICPMQTPLAVPSYALMRAY